MNKSKMMKARDDKCHNCPHLSGSIESINRDIICFDKPKALKADVLPVIQWVENTDQTGYYPASEAGLEMDQDQVQYRELKKIMDNVTVPVLLVAANGRVLVMNPAAVKLFGVSLDLSPEYSIEYIELIKRVCKNKEQLIADELPVIKALRGEQVHSFEFVLNSAAQGELVTDMSAAPIKDDQGRVSYVISLIRDISERVNFEKAKDEFMAIASHELRNPLGVARGLLQLIQMRFKNRLENGSHSDLDDYNKDLKQLNGVLRNIDQMSRIISDLLDASRIESRHLQIENRPVDLLNLIEEVTKRMQATTSVCCIKNIINQNEFPDQRCLVFGDCLRLEQVLVNLISNAINYSLPGQDIEIGLKSTEGQALVFVRDYGIGIPLAEQKRLFQKFFKSRCPEHKNRCGMGLGLYISANIIWEHGGKIWADSEPGKGSTFFFTLPEDDEAPLTAMMNFR